MVTIISAVLNQCGGDVSGGSGMGGAETDVGRGGFFGNARAAGIPWTAKEQLLLVSR